MFIGWEEYKENCFKLVNQKDTWNNAEQQCEENFGGHLAHVESEKHLQWLWQLSDNHPVWIGKRMKNEKVVGSPFLDLSTRIDRVKYIRSIVFLC